MISPRHGALGTLLTLGLSVAASGQASKSLVIGIDGLSPYAFVMAPLPNLQQLRDGTFAAGYSGRWTPHAYTGGVLGTGTQQATNSGPSWSSVLTGVWTDRHGVTDNSFSGSNFAQHPVFFRTLEAGVPNFYSSSVIRWQPIDTHAISSVDQGTIRMDFRATPVSDLDVANQAVQQLQLLDTARPGAVFVHFDDLDAAGHQSGLYSNNYSNMSRTMDSRVGQLLQAVRNRPNFAGEDWQIVVISDHGHRPGGGHGGQTALERFVPMILTEKGAAGGALRSGDSRPAIVDVVPTILDHFGYPIPSNVVGTSRRGLHAPLPKASLRRGLTVHLPLDGSTQAGLAGGAATPVGQLNSAPGRFGASLGVSQYGAGHVRLGNELNLLVGSASDFSISLWVYHDGFTSDPAFLSNKNWNSGNNTGINLAFNPNNTLDFNTKGSTGVRQDIHAFRALPPGQWSHVAFTVERSGATTLYVNGILADQLPSTSSGSWAGAFPFVLLNDGTGQYATNSTTLNLRVDEFAAWQRVLTLDEILALAAHPVEPTPDFDDNGVLDVRDIDALIAAISIASQDAVFDVDGDRLVSLADRDAWLRLAGEENLPSTGSYLVGDANLDGVVDGSDFGLWNANKFTPRAAWSAGDFNADGVVDGSDFGLWNAGKFRAADGGGHVPEPLGLGGLGIVMLGCGFRKCRKKHGAATNS